MIPTFILGLFGVDVPAWLKGPLKWLAYALIVVALLAGIYAWIEHRGETKGAAKVAAKVEKAHAERVAEGKADSAKGQTTVDAIGARVARTDAVTTEIVRSKIAEINNALDATPAAAAGGPPPIVDSVRLGAPIDTLIDRANRAADTADAQP